MDRAERNGLGIAIIGHATLFTALYFLMHQPQPLTKLNPPIDIVLVDQTAAESSAPEIAESAAPPAPVEAPAAEAAPAAAPEPPRPIVAPPIARPEPQPVPKPVPVAKPVPTPKPAPKVEPKPKPKPAPKAETKPKPKTTKPTAAAKADPRPTNRLKGLNLGTGGSGTAPKAGGSTAANGAGSGNAGAAPKGAPAEKTAAQIKQSIRASIYAEVRPQFRRLAPDGVDIEQLVTTIEVRVNPNGSLAGEPRLVSQTGKTDSNRPQQALHVERAIKAVKVSSPFAMSEKDFSGVQVIQLEFKIQ